MKASTKKGTANIGLVGTGVSGAWSIDIDETLRGKEKWYADLEGPSAYLSFQLVDLDIVDKMIAFFDKRALAATPTELIIGNFGQASVSLVWDDEEEDRCFVIVGPQSNCCLRLTLGGEDTPRILDVLRQLREELPD